MKAQRRHELQQSDLAKVIKQAPGFWQQSGGKYLLAAIAFVVIVILVRYRMSSKRADAAAALDNLAQARLLVEQMERLPRRIMFVPPGQAAVERRQIFNDATTSITEATARSDDRQIAAEAAIVARGDLNWATSTVPELPGATTQPSLQFKDPKELLAAASDAYQNVLNSYSDIKHAAIAARFGLAAIAENRGDFDAAKNFYDAIVAQSSDVLAYQKLAADRLRILGELKKPVIFAKPATEPVEPPTTAQVISPLIATTAAATQSAATQPAKPQAATAPTSQP